MIFRRNITNELLKGPLRGKTLDDLTDLMDSGKITAARISICFVDKIKFNIR